MMNIFDYKRRKDLYSQLNVPRNVTPPANASQNQSLAPRSEAQPQHMHGRRRIKNKASDRWVYNQQLLNYYQKVSGGPGTTNQPNVPARPGESPTETADRKEKYRKLLNDWFTGEVIREVFRRHPIHILYISKKFWLFLPFVLIATIAALFLPFVWFLAVPLLLLELGLAIWYINDWSNDFLIVTDRRVIQLEKISFLDTAKIEIPLDKVQEVKINQRHGTIEYIFRVGTVNITSTGRTNIVFQHLYKPERVRQEWDVLRKRYFMARTNFRRDRMRNYLDNKIWGTPLINWNANEEARSLRANDNPDWWQRTFPSEPIYDRDKKQLVWFTHPWILFKKEIPIVLLFILLVVASVIGLPFLFSLGSGLVSILALVAVIIGLAVMSFVIWYKYENWHNDRFIVGEDKIFDVIKLPLGFDETQGVLDIRNVQDVQFEKSGLISNLLNFGTVKITNVGGVGLTFRNVPDPDLVEDEISRRKELLRFIDEERQDRLTADFFATYRDILINGPEEEDQPEDNRGYGGGPRGYR
ncbi:MAG TPA: PH domain-containing protein [Chloroflexia bacterium]|nr:PH domain-containing protein [Chloroflexia bacterium]